MNRLLAGLLMGAFFVSAAQAQTVGAAVTLYAPNGVPIGQDALHPFYVTGGGGSGGGSVTQGTSPWVDNVSQFGGSAVVTGTGAGGSGIPRVTVSTDSTVGLTGTLPAFAATPTVNIGTSPTLSVQGAQTGSVLNGGGFRMNGYDGANIRDISTTTTGALQPPTGTPAATSTALTASTNTTIAAANANRIAMQIQCGSGGVVVSETGATLAAATFGTAGQTTFLPATANAMYTPAVATRTAVTAYTATAQTCVVTEWSR